MNDEIPVVKNGYYTIQIQDLGYKGEGIGRYKGFTVFVRGGIPGDLVEVKIVKINKNFCYGKLIKVITPSADRIRERCPVAGKCGGCQIQNMNYEAQLEFKTRLVKETIERIGKLSGVVIHKCIGMEDPWRYRNKAQFPVGNISGEVAIGFFAPGSHRIIPVDSCLIQHYVTDDILRIIKDFIKKYNIDIYDEATGKGLLRHVVIRTGFNTGETMIVLVINGRNLPHYRRLISMITGEIKTVRSIVLNINRENTNVILGKENITIYGSDRIRDYIGDLQFLISPISFFQVNPIQTQVLYDRAVEYASLTGKETVFDLYSGTGTISLFMAKRARKVYGIEIVEDAAEDARENARINNITNVEFIAGPVEDIIPELHKKGIKADVIVLDPPRKGCDPALLKTVIEMRPARIVYVSCNPATLARDLNILDRGGFQPLEIQPVDMFPHTSHVESVVLLKRKYSS